MAPVSKLYFFFSRFVRYDAFAKLARTLYKLIPDRFATTDEGPTK